MGILPATATTRYRANGMDHVLGWQPVRAGDLGVTGIAAAKRAALVKQFRACRPVDGAVNAATTQQGGVSGIDDGINAERRNVGDDNFQSRRERQAEAAALTATPLSAKSCCNSPAWNISRIMSQPPTNSPLT